MPVLVRKSMSQKKQKWSSVAVQWVFRVLLQTRLPISIDISCRIFGSFNRFVVVVLICCWNISGGIFLQHFLFCLNLLAVATLQLLIHGFIQSDEDINRESNMRRRPSQKKCHDEALVEDRIGDSSISIRKNGQGDGHNRRLLPKRLGCLKSKKGKLLDLEINKDNLSMAVDSKSKGCKKSVRFHEEIHIKRITPALLQGVKYKSIIRFWGLLARFIFITLYSIMTSSWELFVIYMLSHCKFSAKSASHKGVTRATSAHGHHSTGIRNGHHNDSQMPQSGVSSSSQDRSRYVTYLIVSIFLKLKTTVHICNTLAPLFWT